MASTAVRPPMAANTWSRATLSARIEPNWSRIRDQNSCRRTPRPYPARTGAARTSGRTGLGRRSAAYPGAMFSTGSSTWDVVLQIGIAAALLVSIILLIRDYRGRR